ncbi:thiamine phosphate synthase [Brevundimonas sp.]|uniref:thiamine phosphate synthase n=1 Tax=Brevundimonas sp. TaxID=1871086 RepID=UPI0025BF1C61|nr:thiamine phosphate synthase [Brevundimonas sp.]
MTLTPEAKILWETAVALDRANPAVSLPPLLFLTDPARTPRPWETAGRLPAGAAVIHRHFGAADAGEMARRLRETTAAAGVRLLIALDPDLAEAVGADGAHLPERAVDQAAALRARRPDWLITGAWHGGPQADAPVDALVLSPVFSAGGASAARPALGMARFTALVAAARRPVYALGGIEAGNAPSLIGTGACGLAGVGAIQAAFAT